MDSAKFVVSDNVKLETFHKVMEMLDKKIHREEFSIIDAVLSLLAVVFFEKKAIGHHFSFMNYCSIAPTESKALHIWLGASDLGCTKSVA